jgi:hypothetical protein
MLWNQFFRLLVLRTVRWLLLFPILPQRRQAATKQEKGLGDIKMLWQDDGGKMISKL